MFIFAIQNYNSVIKNNLEEIMKDFESIFKKVKPIVLKFKRYFFIHLWDHDDWIQEGRIVLFKLLDKHPELKHDEERLFCYFKTKFSNHLKDTLRKQESQKRQFDKMAYEEISEISHCVKDSGLLLDEYVAYRDVITQVHQQLSLNDKQLLKKVICGESFRGKANFLRKIKPLFDDFKER